MNVSPLNIQCMKAWSYPAIRSYKQWTTSLDNLDWLPLQVGDECQVNLSFHGWLGSVTERINQTMHYQVSAVFH